MSKIALFVGGTRDGKRLAVPVHNAYFIAYERDAIPPQAAYAAESAPIGLHGGGVKEVRYVNTGLRIGDIDVYLYEPILEKMPFISIQDHALELLVEGYRAPHAGL